VTNGPNLIAVNVGNSRTQVARFIDGELEQSQRFNNRQLAAIVQLVFKWWEQVAKLPQAAVLLASVDDRVADRLAAMIEDQLSIETYRVGEDLPVPIGQQLDPETITGIDRLLNAAAAFDRIQQACIVIDAGTAVTVDFVDGEGTFHGGAIAPGAALQLRALHEHTDALPDLPFGAPDGDPFGRSTAQAMLHGVYHGIRGTVQRLVELYAEHYGAYPQIVATGGDAKLLFESEELVDNIVPDLTVLGIAAAAKHALAGDEVDGPDVRP
jgi:type III pantothenate kinase